MFAVQSWRIPWDCIERQVTKNLVKIGYFLTFSLSGFDRLVIGEHEKKNVINEGFFINLTHSAPRSSCGISLI